jgi:uncharacterized membrane protein YoaT (DUF817 family)
MEQNNQNDKNTTPKKKFVDMVRDMTDLFKENTQFDVLLVYAVLVLVLILVGTLACGQPVVPVCLALIIESGIAILLHNMELWIHGAAAVIQIIAGILIGRAGLMGLCVILYALTIVAMMLLDKTEKHA